MSITSQAIRARRKAKFDPRYARHRSKDAATQSRRLAEQVAAERLRSAKGKK